MPGLSSMPDRALTLPPGFRFGVATSGFQTEGGYNGPGQPANNWRDWEQTGRAEPSGIALDFWNRYPDHLDRAVAAGCDAFRLSMEWARCEPLEGQVDRSALDRYGSILDACHERGLLPVVALHHFTHPHWLGPDFWLDLSAPERFAEWVGTAVSHLRDRCGHWITINEPNAFAFGTYLVGALPPGRRLAAGQAVRALDHLLTAHVLSYQAIHARQPDAVVSTDNHAASVYELDRLAIDVLLARSHGVGRHDLRRWLAARRAAHHAATGPPVRADLVVRRLARSMFPLEQALPRAVAAVYDSPFDRFLDVVQVNYYNPNVGERLRVPGHRTAGGRSWSPFRNLWDDPIRPGGLVTYCQANADPGLGLWVAENGMCNLVRAGRAYPRRDGWDRVRYLQANLAAVVDAIDGGLPVSAYFHWCLSDSYEWGSYDHRFGLYGVDRAGGGARWRDVDSFGDDAAGAYRRLAEGLRAGDRSVLDAPRVGGDPLPKAPLAS